MNITSTLRLNDKNTMPRFGLGVYLVKQGNQTKDTVLWALEAGYRLLDTASFYHNEQGVGNAIKQSGIPREQIFVTTKLWNNDHGYQNAIQACDNSLRQLNTDYADLYLIHWPGPDKTIRLKTWEALLKLKQQQKVKSIGVSNFKTHHLQEIIDEFGMAPSVNQVELHPYYPQNKMRDFAKKHDIAITAWGPLFHRRLSEVPHISDIGAKYNKTGAQAVLRWHLQNGIAIIPKSVKQTRLIENADIFDFKLKPEDLKAIDNLNSNTSYGPNPDDCDMSFYE